MNEEHLQILNQGVAAWNQWRASNPDVAPDLSEANAGEFSLHDTQLRGADLRRTDLRQSVLQGAKLEGASLREADLRGADLSDVIDGLRPEQVAGADLTNAKLPEGLHELFKDLKAVNDISESARKLFMAMLAACFYSWLTIATTTDANLITNRASSPLPVIQTSIPIVGFYVVAPLLLLCVYFYFHFYLQKLWEELGSLPAIFPEGRRLHERSDPWLLNDLVRSHVRLLKSGRPFMSYFQQAISIMLAWWLVPVTLLLFWGRYLPRHDFYWTTLQTVLLASSITAAVFLYRLAAATLRGAERPSFSWKSALKMFPRYTALGTFLAIWSAFMVISVGAIGGVPPGQKPWWRNGASGLWGWVPRVMDLTHYSPFANLKSADVSIKPANWTGKDEKELDLVKGADLAGTDLRYAQARGAFLVKADLGPAGGLSDTRLEGADLSYSDLRQANLMRAHLDGARVIFADLTGAHLNGAYLSGTHLSWAHLNGAELDGANLSRANLVGADLTGADLSGANLSRARLIKSHLNSAKMSANLTAALLRGADLTKADLTGADLRFADFRPLGQAQTTGLSIVALKTAKNWDKAYYDDDTLKDLGLPANNNQKLEEERTREQQKIGQSPEGAIN